MCVEKFLAKARYFFGGLLTAAALFLVLIITSGVAYGQTPMSDQLRDLRKQINQLQQQVISQNNQNSSSQTLANTVSGELGLSNQLLQRGDRGQAVKNLQAALNAAPGISVADSGPGSVGSETVYFGPKTQRAVIKFQSKHQEDILSPLGLTSPTGRVGARTKDKLTSVIGSFNNSQSTTGFNQGASVANRNYQSDGGEYGQDRDSDGVSTLSELRSQFTLDKWSFTQEEKQKIYNMMPPEVQKEHFDGFLDNTGGNYQESDDSEKNSTNPLQDRYEQLQDNNETSLKEQLKGYLALQQLRKPLGLLQKSLADVFGPETAHAQGVFIFGGRIASVEPCPTPPNALQVTVAGPRPGRFAFIPGASQLRPVYDGVPRPGMNTLGNYIPTPGCYGPPPASAPLTQGTIILMGVSEI